MIQLWAIYHQWLTLHWLSLNQMKILYLIIWKFLILINQYLRFHLGSTSSIDLMLQTNTFLLINSAQFLMLLYLMLFHQIWLLTILSSITYFHNIALLFCTLITIQVQLPIFKQYSLIHNLKIILHKLLEVLCILLTLI